MADLEARWTEEPKSAMEVMIAVQFQNRLVDQRRLVCARRFLQTAVARESAGLRLVNEMHGMVRTMKV